jgi:twitching motility protein PilT
MARIDAFLQLGREQGCSDIHFTVGLPPLVRQDGELTPLRYRELGDEEIWTLLLELLSPPQQEEFRRLGSIDISYAPPGLGRFRINACRQLRGLAAFCRVIPERVPRLAELGLPPVVASLAELQSGLVLVTGSAGTGKTTTLAAILDEINRTRDLTLITLEDPIEFLHESDRSLVVQRELGTHVGSFQDGLRSALRQDPDVILVGEMRDFETITAAIEASETGHLVLGTLHARGAYQAIHRILDSFPAESQAQVRHTIADNLRAVVSQELLRVADGRGRRAVTEILIVTPAVAQLIREGKTHQLPSMMATGRRHGMRLLDQELLLLVQAGEIDPDEAFLKASDRRELIFHVVSPELLKLVEGGAPAAPEQRKSA